MPDKYILGKSKEAELYSCAGRPEISRPLQGLSIAVSMLLFFFLTKAVQGNRQTILLWLMGAFCIGMLLFQWLRSAYRYSITSEGVSAYHERTDRLLWYVPLKAIIQIRILKGKVRISISKKTYLVYTGIHSEEFAQKLRELQAMQQPRI
jgi:hypothetical protein